MNERIKSLAIQAGFRSDVTLSDGQGNHIVTKTEQSLEKFAELIVRECADVCYRIDGEYDGEDIMAMWCASGILDHFGLNVDRTCEVDERLVRNP